MRENLTPVFQWLIRQRFRYSVGQNWIPNTAEIAFSLMFTIVGGIFAGILAFCTIFLIAWAWGYHMIKSKLYKYEQQYITELNPVMMDILKNSKKEMK